MSQENEIIKKFVELNEFISDSEFCKAVKIINFISNKIEQEEKPINKNRLITIIEQIEYSEDELRKQLKHNLKEEIFKIERSEYFIYLLEKNPELKNSYGILKRAYDSIDPKNYGKVIEIITSSILKKIVTINFVEDIKCGLKLINSIDTFMTKLNHF